MSTVYHNGKNSYHDFNQEQWANLADNFCFDFTLEEIQPLLGFNEIITLEELNDYYGPLARLIRLHYEAKKNNREVTRNFLNLPQQRLPFIIGITGSVSSGKSTFTRILVKVLELYLKELKIAYLNTDGFIYPLSYLKEHNLLSRKGFPESYNTPQLLKALSKIRSGKKVSVPIYNHIIYDILPDKQLEINRPDILIVEGLNILQSKGKQYHSKEELNNDPLHMLVSDFIDFSIYIDADLKDLKAWYIKRFLTFKNSMFKLENSYFKLYAQLTEEQAIEKASSIWDSINEKNLLENILPSRERANLIIEKDSKHRLRKVRLRI